MKIPVGAIGSGFTAFIFFIAGLNQNPVAKVIYFVKCYDGSAQAIRIFHPFNICNVHKRFFGFIRDIIAAGNSGPLLNQKAAFPIPSCSNWDVLDEKGSSIVSYFGAPTWGDLSKGRRHYKATFSFSSKMAPEARQLRVHGALSCDRRWPLMIDIPLLDRTAKTAAKAAMHR